MEHAAQLAAYCTLHPNTQHGSTTRTFMAWTAACMADTCNTSKRVSHGRVRGEKHRTSISPWAASTAAGAAGIACSNVKCECKSNRTHTNTQFQTHLQHRNPRIPQRGAFKSKNMFRRRLVEYTHGEPSSFMVVDGPDAAVLVNYHHCPFVVTSLFGAKDGRGFSPGKCAAAVVFREEVVSPLHETRRCIVALASNDGSSEHSLGLRQRVQSISMPFDRSFVVSLPSNAFELCSVDRFGMQGSTTRRTSCQAPCLGQQQYPLAPSRRQRADTHAALGTT